MRINSIIIFILLATHCMQYEHNCSLHFEALLSCTILYSRNILSSSSGVIRNYSKLQHCKLVWLSVVVHSNRDHNGSRLSSKTIYQFGVSFTITWQFCLNTSHWFANTITCKHCQLHKILMIKCYHEWIFFKLEKKWL